MITHFHSAHLPVQAVQDESLFRILTIRQKDVALHSSRVAEIAVFIGKIVNLSAPELRSLLYGTMFHDLGKLAISDDILLSLDSLSPKERKIIQDHPRYGYDLLKHHQRFGSIAYISLLHHERWDGKGYPSRLSGENIPLLARICAIADAYEAITADRPYRKGKNPNQALEELLRNKGTQFDPHLIDVFSSNFEAFNSNSLLETNFMQYQQG